MNLQATLPNGDTISVSYDGYTESDTNAFIEDESNSLYYFNDEEMTNDELNSIEVEYVCPYRKTLIKGYIHEAIWEIGE